ncbi:hypothetical protein CcaverHIS002_0311940 [Cutaneotrichosporon cavernicola]|nr:hypothetical protein CcaverHIS002_0311940 [Cutaneotrichosporon cavernicola]
MLPTSLDESLGPTSPSLTSLRDQVPPVPNRPREQDQCILDTIDSLLGGKKRHSSRGLDLWLITPKHMMMGSMTGDTFTQFLSSPCLQKERAPPGKPGKRRGKALPLSFVSFDFSRKLLVAKATFDVHDDLPRALDPLDIELPLSDITAGGMYVWSKKIDSNLREVRVMVSFRRPPRYFCRFEMETETKGKLHRRRATQFDFFKSDIQEAHGYPIHPINNGSAAYPLHWNAYQWVFEMDEIEFNRTKAAQLMIRRIPDLHIISNARYPATVEPNSFDEWNPPDLSDLDFEVRTLAEGLIGTGILRPQDWPDLLESLDTATLPYSRDAKLRVLESLFTEERIYDIKTTLQKRLRTFKSVPHTKDIKHVALIRTIQITPTRMLIGPPQQEASNTVTRKYADHLDDIIRVQFADEGDRIHILDYAKDADQVMPGVGLMARIRRALNKGIRVGGKLFFPIASSGSQQKDHSIWFFNPAAIDRTELFRWIGTVKETVVAKYAARMGLPFSTSRQIDLVIKIGKREDVEINGHCFTDGCSVAGTEVMWKAAEALRPNKTIQCRPSAIQFRLGGAKGMLACWPELAESNEVLLRKSQVKFNSDQVKLNVIRATHYQPAFLNRQFIMIMEANGVPQELFLELFDRALEKLQGFEDRIKAGTLTVDDLVLLGSCREFPISTLLQCGFNANPFVLDLCRLIKGRALQDLKWRNRLKIDGGVFLMGICDEVACLAEGEVFCQYQVDYDSEPIVVTGEVLVCRAPALHPGDVRRAMAVDRPKLRHLTNVVVFSTKGALPLPSMLGGGDLDGDDYTLIWDQRFVQPLKEFKPMNYTPPAPIRVDQVTQEHVNENFINYIMNDILGKVDNAHLANSDCYTPFHPFCLKLVDFAKTGQPAELDPDLVPDRWPDFMGKVSVNSQRYAHIQEESKTYRSGKILGQLFRKVIPEPVFKPTNLTKAGYDLHPRLVDMFEPNLGLFVRLQFVKSRYEHDLQYTMRRFNVQEGEIVTSVPAHNRERMRSREQQHLHEALDVVYQAHVETTRENALKASLELVDLPTGTRLEEYIAWHAYMLAFEARNVMEADEQINRTLGGPGSASIFSGGMRILPLMSFPFVWWPELIALVTKTR